MGRDGEQIRRNLVSRGQERRPHILGQIWDLHVEDVLTRGKAAGAPSLVFFVPSGSWVAGG